MLAGTKATLYLILYVSMFSISCSPWAPKDLALFPRIFSPLQFESKRILDKENKNQRVLMLLENRRHLQLIAPNSAHLGQLSPA